MKFAPLFAAAAGSLAVAPLCPALTETILLDQGAPATALVPNSAADAADGSGLAWQHPNFDDGAWLTGTTGIGYETSGSNYAPLLGLNVAAMRNFRSSAYARIEFDAPADLSAFRSLTLRMKFDDGYAAWLNGTPVARSQAPAFDQLTWNEPSTGDHPDSAAEQFEDADITAHLPALRPGRNVLAIQILNGTIDSSDALALPQLVATDVAPPVFPDLRLEPFASGFPQLVDIQNAGDGSGRLFVLEQSGIIRVLDGGITQTFLNISGRVQSGGERGLLGLAFPPSFPDGGKDHFYVYYTTNAAGRGGDTVVSRFQLGGDGLGDPDSEEEILTADQPYQNHNGGQIRFGPDGFLYIGLGDGGDRDDPANRAQNPQSLLGKMLRLDPESGAATYSIPPGNPW
ncbi:MAG: PQQ-dependent sugar dehydrogenase [Verrucomicrobiales bacterium]